MNNETLHSRDDIIASNMREISLEQSAYAEARICEISEIARAACEEALEMYNDGYGVYEILSVISETVSSPMCADIHKDALTENRERLRSYLELLTRYDKTVFTELFLDGIAKGGIDLREGDFLSSDEGNGKVTYVKNPLADEAYDVFSQDFTDLTLKYSQTFAEACAAVRSDEAEYALLPLEERGGARLSSVAQLIFSEDLRINSVTPVFGYEGTADMKYALVSKHFYLPRIKEDDDRYLEIRLPTKEAQSLSELLVATESFGIKLYRVNTVYFDSEDGRLPYYSVVFREEGGDFAKLLTYLTLFSGEYTPVGLYKNLE